MNLCRSCQQDFSSVRAFDKHRVGKHEYLYDDEHEDGRRCLTLEQLRDAGFCQNARGRWELAEEADRARRAFRRTAEEANK